MKKTGVLGIVFILIIASCTVVKHDEVHSNNNDLEIYFDNEDFDAAAYTEELWDSRILPTIKEKAINIDELLRLKQENSQSAYSGDWAVQKDETAPINYMISGTGIVTGTNLDTAAATIDIDTGENIISIQIGPVVKYTSIRDSMNFINFDDFSNQLEFANVSKEINQYVKDRVLSGLDRNNLMGKRLDFYGCYTDNQNRIIITAVDLHISEGGN